MLMSFLLCLLVFIGVTFGLGSSIAMRLSLDQPEKILASAVLSITGVFLFAWLVYVCALPPALLWLLPALAATSIWRHRRSLAATLGEADSRTLIKAQLIIMAWSAGWLALVQSYSGGGWIVDWFNHMQRTWFFLDHGPRDILFSGFDPLTSRPPLANVVNGAFLEATQRDFAHYQFFSTLLGSLVFLPAGLLARRWGGSRAIGVLTLLFMVNPMFAENVTFAWTKLPAAFFTLAALYFFLRAHDKDASPASAVLFATSLAAGCLTHYSTGPYAVVLGAAWLVLGWSRRKELAWWRTTNLAAVSGAMILAIWFGWIFAVYGLRGSLLTNSSITDRASDAITQLQVATLNLRDTLVPHFLRQLDFTTLSQTSSAGWWRDWFFNLYQVNFFLAFGSVAWAVIMILLIRHGRSSSLRERSFWASFIGGNVLLGVAVVGGRDTWGLAHICLQPLVLLGLAFLAGQWEKLGPVWRLALIAGATVDFALGIILQFGMEANALDRWAVLHRPALAVVAEYSRSAQMNLYVKEKNHWIFVGDIFKGHGTAVIGLLAGLFFLALLQLNPAPTPTPSKTKKA